MYRSVMANRVGAGRIRAPAYRGAMTSGQLILHAQDIDGLYQRRACQHLVDLRHQGLGHVAGEVRPAILFNRGRRELEGEPIGVVSS
jgi:hypothetical protein